MKAAQVLNSVAHAKGQWAYHIEWIPKYRRNVFRKERNKRDMEGILLNVAAAHGMHVLELAVQPDHVHVVVEVPPAMSLARAAQLLKGRSSYEYFRLHPNLRLMYRKGHLWTPGKFYRTVGDVGLNHMRAYVRNQGDAFQRTLADFSHTKGIPTL